MPSATMNNNKVRKRNIISRRSILKQFLTAMPAAICTFLIGCTVGWSAPAASKLPKETSMTAEEASWLGVVNEVGHMIAPVPGGIIADKYGRKVMLASSGIVSIISWATIAFVRQTTLIYLSRFFLGIAMGFGFCCVYAYMGEISSPEIRGTMCLLGYLFNNIGILFEYAIGEYLSYTNVAIVTSFLSLLYIISLYFIPESPYYLLSVSKNEEAVKIFTWLRDTTEEYPLKEISELENSSKGPGFTDQFKILFSSKSNLLSLGVILALCVLTESSGRTAMLVYATRIFEVTEKGDTGTNITPGQYTILLGVIQLLITFFPFFLSDRIGRVPLLLISSISAGICHLLTVLSFSFHNSWFRFVTVTGYVFCAGIGIAPISATISGDLVAPEIRGIGSGIVSLTFGLCNILGVRLFYEIWHAFSLETAFIVVAIASFFVAIFSYFWFPETKGKTFEEIQDHFK